MRDVAAGSAAGARRVVVGATESRRPSTFAARVIAAVRRIPPGRVATYGDIAALAGRPRASRAVGNIMRGCTDPRTPCHRVIASGGALGGYGAFLSLKQQLLRAEGLEVRTQGRTVNVRPVKVTEPRTPNESASASRDSRSGPDPAIESLAPGWRSRTRRKARTAVPMS